MGRPRDALIVINANLDDASLTLCEGHDLDWLIAYSRRVGNPTDSGVVPRSTRMNSPSKSSMPCRLRLRLCRDSLLSDIAFQPEH